MPSSSSWILLRPDRLWAFPKYTPGGGRVLPKASSAGPGLGQFLVDGFTVYNIGGSISSIVLTLPWVCYRPSRAGHQVRPAGARLSQRGCCGGELPSLLLMLVEAE